MSTCATCTHWRSIAELWEEDDERSLTNAMHSGIGSDEEMQRTWGHCTLIGLGLDKEAKAYTQDASEYLANLYCRSDFGCVEHQAKGIDYDGDDPSVECAWGPCTNRLRDSGHGGPQWCSKAHRDLSEITFGQGAADGVG